MNSTASFAEDDFQVLVVDDSLPDLKLLSNLLRDAGIRPRPVSSGALALAAAKADLPDLVLLDVDMPDMDGFEVCRVFQQDRTLATIPIIFVSGFTDTPVVVKALALGAVDYITKPFQAEEVMARVRTHLRMLQLQRQIRAQNLALEELVAERTLQLAQANQRLEELSALKDEFFGMFAHEIRTPANGLFGMCDLMADLCPPSAELDQYRGFYESSKARLMGLIEDTTLIASLAPEAGAERTAKPLVALLRELRLAVADVPFETLTTDFQGAPRVWDERGLLVRSLSTALRLAACFKHSWTSVPVSFEWNEGRVKVAFGLERLGLSQGELDDFFRLESAVRAASYAEPLGLAPVAAHRILVALGGDMRFEKAKDGGGSLHIELPTESHGDCPGSSA